MKQKKLVIYFITIATLLLIPLPILNTTLLFINNNLELNKLNKKNLFSTDNIESKINYFFYKNFQISLNKKQVIIGKDNFLFLGNGYSDVLDKTNGTYELSIEDIDSWTDKLKDLQKWYEDRGIKFVIVVAPNKHSIYREKLPDWMKYNGKTITDDILLYANKKHINILDLRNLLLKRKTDSKLLYLKTDTHWNLHGASIAYNETIDYINKIYSINLKKPNYNIVDNFRGAADLSYFLKITNLLPKDYENDYRYSFEKDTNICKGNINKDTKELEKCEMVLNPLISINSHPKYTINKIALNKTKLLFLCDSFGKHSSQLYNLTFSTILKLHYGQMNGDKLSKFTLENKPNIVIYQVVEKQLYNTFIVKKL